MSDVLSAQLSLAWWSLLLGVVTVETCIWGAVSTVLSAQRVRVAALEVGWTIWKTRARWDSVFCCCCPRRWPSASSQPSPPFLESLQRAGGRPIAAGTSGAGPRGNHQHTQPWESCQFTLLSAVLRAHGREASGSGDHCTSGGGTYFFWLWDGEPQWTATCQSPPRTPQVALGGQSMLLWGVQTSPQGFYAHHGNRQEVATLTEVWDLLLQSSSVNSSRWRLGVLGCVGPALGELCTRLGIRCKVTPAIGHMNKMSCVNESVCS